MGSIRRFSTFVRFSFDLDFAIVFLSVLAFVVQDMASTSKVNDDVSNFKQYTNKSLLEALSRMIYLKENGFYPHTQIHTIESFNDGLGTWSNLLLDGLSYGDFKTSMITLVLSCSIWKPRWNYKV
jgi:cbb3-type cytochrome oxidase cytochrome c subunit